VTMTSEAAPARVGDEDRALGGTRLVRTVTVFVVSAVLSGKDVSLRRIGRSSSWAPTRVSRAESSESREKRALSPLAEKRMGDTSKRFKTEEDKI
jgi:hypothetical protein